jgi:hypothetical protein
LNDMFFDGELFNLGLTNVASDPNAEWRGMPSFNQEDQLAWRRLIVNFRCAEDLKQFAAVLNQIVTEETRSIWYPENEREVFKDKVLVSEP